MGWRRPKWGTARVHLVGDLRRTGHNRRESTLLSLSGLSLQIRTPKEILGFLVPHSYSTNLKHLFRSHTRQLTRWWRHNSGDSPCLQGRFPYRGHTYEQKEENQTQLCHLLSCSVFSPGKMFALQCFLFPLTQMCGKATKSPEEG